MLIALEDFTHDHIGDRCADFLDALDLGRVQRKELRDLLGALIAEVDVVVQPIQGDLHRSITRGTAPRSPRNRS